jgi:hypothetical protein
MLGGKRYIESFNNVLNCLFEVNNKLDRIIELMETQNMLNMKDKEEKNSQLKDNEGMYNYQYYKQRKAGLIGRDTK